MRRYHGIHGGSRLCSLLLAASAVSAAAATNVRSSKSGSAVHPSPESKLDLERFDPRHRELSAAETSLRLAMERLLADDCDSNGTPDECDVDCNTNGSPDDLDLFRSVSRDCNGNRTPDECEGIPRADLDCDGDVDAGDLAVFRACHPRLNQSVPPDCESADIDADGNVDCADWRAMRASWTTDTPPNYARCRTPSAATPSVKD